MPKGLTLDVQSFERFIDLKMKRMQQKKQFVYKNSEFLNLLLDVYEDQKKKEVNA